jgi:MFS family permease
VRTIDVNADRARAWAFLGLLWIAFLINNIDRQSVFSVFPVLTKQLNFSGAQLGLVGSVFLWTYCFSNPVLGRLADVIRPDRLVIASVILWSLATLGTGLSTSASSFLFSRAVLGLVESLYAPAALCLIAEWHPGSTRSMALAIHSTAQFTGIAVGGWFGGWAEETIGWRRGFWALAGIGIVHGIILSLVFRRKSNLPTERKHLPSPPFEVFRSHCFVALLIAFTSFSAMLWILYGWLPMFIFTKYGASLAGSGLAATAYLQAGSVTGVLTWGLVADLISRRVSSGRLYLIALNILFCTPCAILILNADSLESLKMATVGFGFFAGGLSANVTAAAFDVVSKKNYGFVVGIINLAAGVGGGASMFLVGWTNRPTGMVEVLKWTGVAALAAAVALVVVSAKSYRTDRHRVQFDVEG